MVMAARDRLARTLRADAQTAFSVELKAKMADLSLQVEGFGQVRFPVTPAKARKLAGLGQPARFGRGEKTVTDPDVRDTWEIPKHLVRAEWDDATLKDILATVKDELGLPNAAELTADLHSLLVYEPNQFFLVHQDSEKDDSMVGTLVVTLPSSYAGGELMVGHNEEWKAYRGSKTALSLVAFYADCRHEVLVVNWAKKVRLAVMAATPPTPARWPSSGASVSTGIQGRPSSWAGSSKSSTRPTRRSWQRGPACWCRRCWPSAGSGPAGTRCWSAGCPAALPSVKRIPRPSLTGLSTKSCGPCCGCARPASRTGRWAPRRSCFPPMAFACGTSGALPRRRPPGASTMTSRPSWPRSPDRTAAAAGRVLDADAARRALVHLQRSALDPVTVSSVRGHKGLLAELRTAVASVAGIEVPKLAEAKRVSWVNLLFGIGSLIGIWAIVGVLADVAGSFDVIKGARWGWVTLAFVLAQLPVAASALATVGAATGELPYGRCLALETSNMFTALAGGDVAVFAVRVRFFQRQGYDPATALSSGAIASAASWVAKGLLFLASIGFAAGTFHAPRTSGGHQKVLWAVAGVVLAAGIAAAVITVIPRLRRLTSARVRPHLVHIWADIKSIAAEPRKIIYVLAGSVLSQLLVALALGAALHAVGEKASIATLLVVITTASMIGGAVPVPGGAGVVEAGLIAGLTSAGVPQDQAVAAIFIQRLFTAYLPPIWGWVTLAWMRRREYV
jgi:uncharacterized membrane protein YbhN (UPF0104 family)